MRAYVQTLAGVHLNTQGARAAQGFRELGIECREFLDDEELEDIRREDILLAGDRMLLRRMAALGVVSPYIEPYPKVLMPYMGRRTWRTQAKELAEEDLPLFLRPVRQGQFHATVAYDKADLSAAGVVGDVWASEVVWFGSTWRAFVRYGEPLAVLPAEGDLDLVVDEGVVRDAIASWADAPAGVAIDFGVDEAGRTLVVRARDVLALSPLGLDARSYALVLAARWAELVGAADPLREVSAEGALG